MATRRKSKKSKRSKTRRGGSFLQSIQKLVPPRIFKSKQTEVPYDPWKIQSKVLNVVQNEYNERKKSEKYIEENLHVYTYPEQEIDILELLNSQAHKTNHATTDILERCEQIYFGKLLNINETLKFIAILDDSNSKVLPLGVIKGDKIYSKKNKMSVSHDDIQHVIKSIQSKLIKNECPDLDDSNLSEFFKMVIPKTNSDIVNSIPCSAVINGKFVHGIVKLIMPRVGLNVGPKIFYIEDVSENPLPDKKNDIGVGDTLYFNTVFTQPKHITQLKGLLVPTPT